MTTSPTSRTRPRPPPAAPAIKTISRLTRGPDTDKSSWRARHPRRGEIGLAGLAGWGAVGDDLRAARRRRLPLGAREPVDKSGVGALAGTPDCCLEHALQHRFVHAGLPRAAIVGELSV